MYTKEHAERLKAHAGEKWRPANGTEGDIFTHHVCGSCGRGPSPHCPIATAVLMHDVTDPGYPAEWQIGRDGLPTCAAWRDRARLAGACDTIQ